MASVGRFAPGLLAVLVAAVACGRTGNDSPNATSDGAIGVVGGQSDADIQDGASSTLPDAGAEWDAYAGEVPDAFPDDCATALPVIAEYLSAGTSTCRLSPGNVACESTNDCIVSFLPQCCGSSIAVGVNRDASLVCLPPNGCLPPPGSGPCSPSVATEDCQAVAGSHDVGVACVNSQCLTYAIGP